MDLSKIFEFIKQYLVILVALPFMLIALAYTILLLIF